MARIADPIDVALPTSGHENPFVRYRGLLHPYHRAVAGGLDDAEYVARIDRLDEAVARVDGRGFARTPCREERALAERLGLTGPLWIKDETHNVSGSHKGRHLFGILAYLEVARAIGLHREARLDEATLAIASCGNAALAAAVVARAAERRLEVFIPPDARASVVARLERLGARTTVCTRSAGSVGDPCYQRFREAVTAGALPLSCQGGDNGLTIEGGRTLGYELAEAIAGRGLDRVFVQVGGGALASALVQSLAEAARRGWLPAMPRVHAVQTTGAYPLVRAWRRFADDVLETLPHKGSDDAERARAVHLLKDAPAFEAVRARMARERSRYMRPWESEPRSVAHGILDDETYDFRAVVEGMARSGGWPVVASEEELLEANALAREATGIDADETGTAGLAGLLAMRRAGMIAPDERVAAIFSGARRN